MPHVVRDGQAILTLRELPTDRLIPFGEWERLRATQQAERPRWFENGPNLAQQAYQQPFNNFRQAANILNPGWAGNFAGIGVQGNVVAAQELGMAAVAEPAAYPKPSVESQATAITEAAAFGLGVIKSDNYTLLLDIDAVRDRKHFGRALALCKEIWPDWGWSVEEWDSRSGNTHIKVSIPKTKGEGMRSGLHVAYRVALEAALGSDRMRSIYSIAACVNGIGDYKTEASILFRPAEASVDEGDEV